MKNLALTLIIISLFIPILVMAEPIRVGVLVDNGAYSDYQNNIYKGFAVDLWEAMAANEHLEYRYTPVTATVDQAIQDVADGKYDVILGATAVSYPRFRLVDFSRTYFLTKTGVIVHKKKPDLEQLLFILWDVFTSPFIIGFIIYFILYIHILWLFERGTNKELPQTYGHGMSFIMWLHMSQRQNWKLPSSIPGRIAAFSWIITAGLLITSVTAAVTSKLTLALALHSGQFSKVGDLENQKVAVVEGTFGAEEAKKIGANLVYVATVQDAFKLLAEKKVDAAVGDYIFSKSYLANNNYPRLTLANFSLGNMEFAFPLRKNSPYREAIDRGLLFLQYKDYSAAICAKTIGVADAKNCDL